MDLAFVALGVLVGLLVGTTGVASEPAYAAAA
jgi:hypothetical protein